MPKQRHSSKSKASQPPRKIPETPNTLYNKPTKMPSPKTMQPSTNSRPSFNRQAGECPNLNPAREVFKRSYEKIMAACTPKTHVQPKNAIAAITQQTIFETLLADHLNEIQMLREELMAVKEENQEFKVKLMRAGLLENKRKKLGGKLTVDGSDEE